MSGTHAAAPDGYLLAVGDGIRAEARSRGPPYSTSPPRSCTSSACPWPGTWRGGSSRRSSTRTSRARHAVTFIPSYESLVFAPVAAEPPPLEDLPPLPEEAP